MPSRLLRDTRDFHGLLVVPGVNVLQLIARLPRQTRQWRRWGDGGKPTNGWEPGADSSCSQRAHHLWAVDDVVGVVVVVRGPCFEQ